MALLTLNSDNRFVNSVLENHSFCLFGTVILVILTFDLTIRKNNESKFLSKLRRF